MSTQHVLFLVLVVNFKFFELACSYPSQPLLRCCYACFIKQLIKQCLSLQANTFQAVIAADQQKTFVFFIYGDIQWGAGANIGFGAGDGTRSFMVPGALTNQVLNIDEGSNVNMTGVYIYRVDLYSVLGPKDGEKPKLLLVL